MANPSTVPTSRDSVPVMSVSIEAIGVQHDGLIALVQDVSRSDGRSAWAWMVALAVAIHFGLLWGAGHLFPTASQTGLHASELQFIEAPVVDNTPAPASEPEPPAARDAPKQESLPKPASPPPDPEARAQAGKVLTAPAETKDPGAGDSMVSGDHEHFAGGATAASGTATQAVAPPPPVVPAPAAAPAPAPPVDTVAATRSYLGRVRQALAQAKRYPAAAQRLGIEGTVVVSFCISATGAFSRVSIAGSSGSDILDQAAVAAVSALSGRIPRPAETGGTDLPLRTSLQFEMTR